MATNTPKQGTPTKTLFAQTLVENIRKAREIMELAKGGENYLAKVKGGEKTKK